MSYNPIICAVDTTDIAVAKNLSAQLAGKVGALKLGLEFFTANGAAGVQQVANAQAPVFLDLKFHDIPNTVSKAVKATAPLDIFILTVHTAGGRDMMKAAADAASENSAKTGKRRPIVVGVTVLTSMDEKDLAGVGIDVPLADQVKRLAALAKESGLDGVVCSPWEIELIKQTCGKNFKLVVPGIRPAGSASGDQKRIMTPKQAVDSGADYLVIGRPITEASSPADAAASICNELIL